VIFSTWPSSDIAGAETLVGAFAVQSSVNALGSLLVDPEAFVLPFEVASVLLLAALIGAVAVARPEKE